MSELADEADSKSVDGNIVWVQVPSPAVNKGMEAFCFHSFFVRKRAVFYISDAGYFRNHIYLCSSNPAKEMLSEISVYILYYVPRASNSCNDSLDFFYGSSLLNIAITISVLAILVELEVGEGQIMLEQERELNKMRVDMLLWQIKPQLFWR